MKFRYKLTFITALVCFSLQAKPSFDYFEESQNGLCKPMLEKEGPLAMNDCISLMLEDSEKKLSARITEVKNKLKKINNSKLTKAFFYEQKLWSIYKKDRCLYFSSDTEKDSFADWYMKSICQTAENYRRIDTLEGEP